MRVVLINPNVSSKRLFGKIANHGNFQQPLGILYIAAFLREHGYEVSVIDAQIFNLDNNEVVTKLKKINPDLIGITATTTTITSAAQLAKKIKENLDVPIVLGGPHISGIPEDLKNYNSIDMGVVGEGELTFLELTECIEKGKDPKNGEIKGLVFLKNNKIVQTERREYIQNLDDLPFPARDLVPPLKYYKQSPASCKYEPYATLITSRGCIYRCTFCDRSVFGNYVRVRSPRNVIDELLILKDKFHANEFRFWDDTFNLDNKRVIELCKGMIREGVDLPWTCFGRLDRVTEEQLKWMKRAGCWQISYGIESGSNQILKNVRKGITTQLIRKNVLLTKKMGIEIRGSFILGLPGESKKTIQETIKFARSLPLDTANFFIATPYPNTELYEEALKNGELKPPNCWDKFGENNPEHIPYTPNGLSKACLQKYFSKAHKSFYFRLTYILRKTICDLRNPRKFILEMRIMKDLINI
jgi:radical SAM superfamily enzyme YgiQ (UPF0313 family)